MRRVFTGICSTFLSVFVLSGCGTGSFAPENINDGINALNYPSIGGDVYENFKISPQLPKETKQRSAVKLTYLMNDDSAHQSPFSLRMINMLDDLPQKNVYNIVFRDGHDEGDAKLYYIQKGDTDPNTLRASQSYLAPGVGEVQSNNPRLFSQILGWTMDNYPGKRKYLQIYTHGAGVSGLGTDENQTDLKGKPLEAKDQVDVITVPKFAESLKQALKGRKLDVIYFRACLMGNIEALYELRGTTNYVIASEDVSYSVDNSNLTMTKMFDDLAGKDIPPSEIARQMSIQGQGKSGSTNGYTTIAAIDINKVDEMKAAINELALALKAGLSKHKQEILDAYDAITKNGAGFQFSGMTDLWAFTAQLDKKAVSVNIKTAVQHLRAAQRKAMLHEKDSYETQANGISIFMPSRTDLKGYYKYFIQNDYQQTKFAKDTGWDDFLLSLPVEG